MENTELQSAQNQEDTIGVSAQNQEDLVENEPKNAVISLKDVDIYQHKTLILSQVSFTVNKGELVYVIGKTGSGKSNLLKLLYGDVAPVNGEIQVAGCDMRKVKSRHVQSLRRRLGIVFQDYQLLQDRSVDDNLRFIAKVTGWKSKKEIDARIKEVLEMVDLQTKGHKLPHQLSGGEQQRICIARALVNRPEIILADEPTGNLDPETSYDIFYLFRQIAESGTAVLVATHDFLIVNQIPSRILQIKDGKLFE
ncbi:MAG: ATP-binding cassette domain-containing protein [Lentimicrobiaceae bacterium]|nr:ATP-binding cassette domain-containing protein [Lentimicrobiaceae bacterium]